MMVNNETSILNIRNFATFILVLFCIRYIPLESRAGPSMLKTFVSGLAFIVMLISCPKMSKGVVLGFLYFFTILTMASIHPDSFRWSTILYKLSFVMVFVSLYNFVWEKQVFTIEYFIKIVSLLIYAYAIVLIIQQMFLLAGIRLFPPINLCQIFNRGIGANSLAGEPSTAARTLGVLYYAYLKCNEYYEGKKLSIKSILNKDHRLVSIAFLWCMLTMGSGTAFISLAILSLYFMRGWGFILTIPIVLGVVYVLESSKNESFQRAQKSIEATQTGDIENIQEADGSASARIVPMVNTLNIDFSNESSWIGEGTDTSLKYRSKSQSKRYIADINDYGLIAYIVSLIFVFGCCIKFFSLGTIMFFAGVGGSTVNFAYVWGLLMVFMCVKYFYDNRYTEIIYEEDEYSDDTELTIYER